MTDLTSRLNACYSGVIYDVMREMQRPNCVLPHQIRAIDPDTRVAGKVFTLRGTPDETVSAEDSMLEWTEFLSQAPTDHVVVCQPQDDVRAMMGELSAETLQYRGIRGYIVDGGSRDNAFIRKIGFPLFSKFQTPRDVVAQWRPEALGEPISIGNVRIRTGDYVIADIDGVVVIPQAIADEVIAKAEEYIKAESLVRKAILSGTDPKQAYLEHGKF